MIEIPIGVISFGDIRIEGVSGDISVILYNKSSDEGIKATLSQIDGGYKASFNTSGIKAGVYNLEIYQMSGSTQVALLKSIKDFGKAVVVYATNH